MKVFKAIGNFFVKIGRWIKDTAWVQPLLIVGGIFAIIFSIPYIVNAVEDSFDQGNKSEAFYKQSQLKLQKGKNEELSEADKLMDYIIKRADDEASVTDAEKAKWGDQFFLSFAQNNCSGCEQVYKGYQTLQQKWNTDEFVPTTDNKNFKMYTIFTDEETDDELIGTQTAFKDVFFERNYAFFENVQNAVTDRPYYIANGGSSSSYAKLIGDTVEAGTFQTPTTFMIDFDFKETKTTNGIVDIIFNFDGKDKEDKSSAVSLARTLIDCWNHTGVFAGEEL